MRLPIAISSAALLTALTLLPGCGDPQAAVANPAFAARSTGTLFLIGPPDQFEGPGVYTQFAGDHGIFLISAHDMLVALADTCPSPAHASPIGVRYDAVAGVFRCPACARKFTSDGLAIAPGTARPNARGELPPGTEAPRSLSRCMIRPFGQLYDPQTPLQVDPGNRFRQDLNQWSDPACMYPFSALESAEDLEKAQNIRIGPILQ